MSRAFDLAPLAERAAEWRTRILTATDGRDILVNSPDGWEHDRRYLWFTPGDNGAVFGNPPPGAAAGALDQFAALPGIVRAVQLICSTLGGLPWQLYRGEYERLETPAWVDDPQATRLDQRVNDPARSSHVRLNSVEFWSAVLADTFLFGDGLVYVPVRDESGQPRPPIWRLDPFEISVEDRGDGERYFVEDVELPRDTILHFRDDPPYHDGRGTGILVRGAPALALNLAVQRWTGQQFSSAVPAGYLKLGAANVTREQANQVRDEFMFHHAGRRGIAVLSALADFQAINVKPVDAELTKTRESSLMDLALLAGLPPFMLGVRGDSATYQNISQVGEQMTRYTYRNWCRRIEETLNAQVPRGQRFKINLDAMERGATKERAEVEKIYVETGIMTLDEVRELEDRPPLEVQP